MGSPMVDVEVKYGREVVTLTMMLSSTIGDLKAELQTKTGVPTEKQRLMFSAPVVKEYRREAKNDVTMESMVPPSLRKSVEEHQGSVAQHIKVSAMMIGRSGAEVPQVDSRATSEVSRLVTTTTQHNGLWYRCSYGSGYVRQTAYLCRTCVESGRAEADHSICLACASICHGNHEVEEWGVRSYMRCDCCTIRCSKVTNTNGAAASPPLTKLELEPSVVQTISSADVAKRSKRRRSRSSSPLTPKRTGGSPMSGFRVSASTGPSPFSLMDPPPNEQRAISSPIVSASQARQAEVAVQQRCADNVVEPEPFPAATDTGADGVVEKAANDESDLPPLPEFPRCCFIVDKETEKPPANAIIPPNRRNRYPRKSTKWCFCEDDHPSDDPDYSGIVCMLCTTCFWSTHMTRLMADQYRRLPCYGDVVSGDTLAFNCDTCKVQVCAPCRFRCHKDHNITEIITVPTEEGPNPDMPFSCGCRSRCLISDSVPPEDVDDEMHYMPIPNDVAIELMNDDVFTGFICSYCMQENPWILENDFAKCYQGQLPPKYTGALLPPPPCGAKSGEPLPEGYYPYHGMIFPTQGFSAEMICSCEPCQKAMHDFAPCATEDAANMVAKLHDSCDNCGKLMKEGFSYICQTCEMTESSSFFVCEECYQIRCRLVAGQNRIFPIGGPVETPGAPGSASATPEPPTESTAVQEASPSDPSLTFQHDLAHQFVEDTKDNLTTICVMQMAQNLDAIDPELMEWITNEGGSIPTDALQMTFGQTPIEFSQEELDDFASMNTNQPHPPAKSASTKSPAKKHK